MTTNTQHTPGPWTFDTTKATLYDKNGKWANDCQRVNKAGAYCVAQVVGSIGAEREANARLIAAAPDLLAALKALCAWGDHPALTKLPDGEPVAAWAPSFDETVKMVDAAIAKAEGRSA